MGPLYHIIPSQDPDSGLLLSPSQRASWKHYLPPVSSFSALEFSFCNGDLCDHLIWWVKPGNASSLATELTPNFATWQYRPISFDTFPCAQVLTKLNSISCTHHVCWVCSSIMSLLGLQASLRCRSVLRPLPWLWNARPIPSSAMYVYVHIYICAHIFVSPSKIIALSFSSCCPVAGP